ncbi:NAD(P)-dependent oxidoreductase [uncultured Vibrio sp.]|uniref:NAD(P)-dependent oxidoreductase n=1 Tax=uncultured Vibrio sp. TaxID=114054 RepID=UPI0025E42A37|nr:NAD(P)-binding oxidoreductase [uncultured Vibrio sp.]
MTTLVLGATGATGRLVVKQLLDKQQPVKMIVRSVENLSIGIISHDLVSITRASILDLNEQALIQHIKGCDSIVCCLGHNLTVKGIWGQPTRLVTEVMKRVCHAISSLNPAAPIKLILMSTTGFQDLKNRETVSIPHRCIVALLRLALPPHVDNEAAARFLQDNCSSKEGIIKWVGVRPDSLIDQLASTDYDLHPSPVYDPIFDARATSRVNVAHFMVELISNPILWQHWQGRFPVIYNSIKETKKG